MIVVVVLITSCQVSVNPNINPPMAQAATSSTAQMIAAGLPAAFVITAATLLKIRLNNECIWGFCLVSFIYCMQPDFQLNAARQAIKIPDHF